MKPKILLRIAAFLMLLHAVGHTFGHSGWKKATDAAKQEVISKMTDQKFPFMGSKRSMGEFYDGYGYACTLALLLIAYLLWITSTAQTLISKKVILAVSICLFLWGGVELIYFFPAAAAFSLVSAVLGIWAVFGMKVEG